MTEDPYDPRVNDARDRLVRAVTAEKAALTAMNEAADVLAAAQLERDRAVQQYITLTEPDEDKPF